MRSILNIGFKNSWWLVSCNHRYIRILEIQYMFYKSIIIVTSMILRCTECRKRKNFMWKQICHGSPWNRCIVTRHKVTKTVHYGATIIELKWYSFVHIVYNKLIVLNTIIQNICEVWHTLVANVQHISNIKKTWYIDNDCGKSVNRDAILETVKRHCIICVLRNITGAVPFESQLPCACFQVCFAVFDLSSGNLLTGTYIR